MFLCAKIHNFHETAKCMGRNYLGNPLEFEGIKISIDETTIH